MPRRPVRSSASPPAGLPHGGSRPRPRGYRWRLILWRLRVPVAAVFLGFATALSVTELRPAPAPTLSVAVAAHDLAPGGALTAADVRVVAMPTALVPSGSHPRADDVVGHSLVVRAPVGLPIVDGLLAGDRLGSAGPPGTVVAPVRLADPAVAALLRPGDRIDLLGSASTADGEPVARQLARRALVLADPGPATEVTGGAAGGLLGVGTDATAGSLTLVAVTPAEAAALAGSVDLTSLSAVVVE